jgi:hypothetical protein
VPADTARHPWTQVGPGAPLAGVASGWLVPVVAELAELVGSLVGGGAAVPVGRSLPAAPEVVLPQAAKNRISSGAAVNATGRSVGTRGLRTRATVRRQVASAEERHDPDPGPDA